MYNIMAVLKKCYTYMLFNEIEHCNTLLIALRSLINIKINININIIIYNVLSQQQIFVEHIYDHRT